ncbi:hypothetical protein [Frigoribacterium sp. VKM Ac-2530]|uniref:hypothetical protein n=1 Tax=Frigoribacterium sp. VKM Ac-2530 TaxID=2783822 RepID=UPI00188ACFA4|nr:hypothetical protein [Frigoribacterium sp. VKM Ac-2530]MBF4578931.1 hypothetical protein [Frigoribacterium sp. VKM Ac-2530]
MTKVSIYMKSGNQIDLEVGEDFSVGTTNGEVSRITWGNSCRPRPLTINPVQIEAVVEHTKGAR